ncbi:UNVERIFIED_ORG: hypothetical protein M2348_000851 [Sphingomonas sp. R1F5B]
MMSVPERKLLIAMDDIAGIVDIQRHRHRRGGIAGAVDVDHCDHHAGQFARGRRILPPAHRWLAGKSRARSRQLAQRQTETRIVAQGVEIIGILIAASNREHAGTQDVIEAMDHPRRVTRIGNASCKPLADPHCTFSLRQQQHATIRGEPATIKRGGHFLARHCWESEWACAIDVHGGCGLWHFLPCGRFGLDTQILIQIRGLRHSRQPFAPP